VSRVYIAWTSALLALVAFAGPTASAAAEQPAATTANFAGEVVYSEETGLLDFSGSLIVTADNLRIDLTQEQTDERVRLLVDYTAGILTVLYPDTLNGTRHQLADFDDAGGFVRIRDALLGRQPEPPEEWTATAAESAELAGVACTKRSATAPDGASIVWWLAGDGRPLKVDGHKQDLRISVSLSDYQPLDKIEPLTFAVPEDYAVEAGQGDAPEGLPRL